MILRTTRKFLSLCAHAALLAGVGQFAASPGQAQNLFETLITVNDSSITRYEIEQRALMLTMFRAPGDPRELARGQLIEDRLKLDAARANGIVLEEVDVTQAMEEFAGRANMTGEQFLRALNGVGVSESSYREFVRAGVSWRELTRARFASRVSVNEDDIERAQAAVSGNSGVRVLVSELIMPAPPNQLQAVQARAQRISQITSVAEFSAQARKYSATPSRGRGGRMPWTALSDLPPGLAPILLGLAPGEVSDPLPIEGAIALFQLRDIEELDAPAQEYSAIEYATYYIAGGRSEQALSRARKVTANIDICDDLYGIAQGEPEENLERTSKAPEEIPPGIALELARLDPGEVSTTLTSADGKFLKLLMLCGRAPKLEGEGPSSDQLAGFIRNQRLDSFSKGYLEQLRSEARIFEKK
ncbi:Periplasmic chaperone and peptidyl-prolyl cis-trans isomerase of outer membrane proteins SurA [hydrothermal vent metagenome]|uniref:Periplasmic chaperone and peptidyl-prolyl cis-trans isomerase of outer membrane proteins SurA n=1 Tax=hydrothermal vent metagenome TaxID=652676 RepID=A0A3B0SFZ2_9ZZZZ